MALLLVSIDALACRCAPGAAAFWPSDARDVPRKVRPLVVGFAYELQLLDAGPTHAREWLTDGGMDPSMPIPGDARPVLTTRRKVGQLGDQVFELVPSEPLPANHLFLFAEGRVVKSAFVTGQRMEGDGPPAPPILELERIEIWKPAVETTCDIGGALVSFRADSLRGRRLLAVWSVGQEQGLPLGFVEVRDGHLKLGRWHVCDRLGTSLSEGPADWVLREWTHAGLGPATRVQFTVPSS
jgi:hypothetical protein